MAERLAADAQAASAEEALCHEADAALKDVTGIGAFIIVALMLGVAVEIVKRKVPALALPVTLLLFLLGVVLELVRENVALGFVGDSIENWKALHPETLLFLFLPPLLFTSAFTVEYHVFRRLMGQAVLLATVGVVICSALLAVVAIFMFDYGWGWGEGLLFGAMFGATDPVAVVALLHDLGAPETLSVMIEGESLLNDGVGFVLFLVFYEQLSGREEYEVGDVFARVFVASLGGMFVGVVVGYLGLKTTQQAWGDQTLGFVVTAICVYGTFFVSEALHWSGVIGVVVLGLFFAAYSDGYMEGGMLDNLKAVWRKLEFVANTVVFVYSGVVVVDVLRASAPTGTARDVANLGLLFVLINVIRAVAVAMLFWPLSKMGYGLSWRQAALVSYSGMRGVVGLIAALLVVNDCSCAPDQVPSPESPCLAPDTKSRMVFHMAGIVALTLAINGTTTKYLVNWFEINKQGPAAQLFFERATVKLHDRMDLVIESLKRHPRYRDADWDTVWKYMPVLSKTVFHLRKVQGVEHPRTSVAVLRDVDKLESARFKRPSCASSSARSADDPEASFDTDSSGATLAQHVAEARLHFLNLIKASYRRQFQEGATKSWPALQVLIEAALRCQDHPDRPIDEWQQSVARYVGRTDMSAKVLACAWACAPDASLQGYEVASTFIRAHKTVVRKFRELSESTNDAVLETVLHENSVMISLAEDYTRRIQEEAPHIVRQAKTNVAIQRLLMELGRYSDKMLDRAIIDEKDHHVIQHALEHSWGHLLKHVKSPTGPVHALRRVVGRAALHAAHADDAHADDSGHGKSHVSFSWRNLSMFSDIEPDVLDVLRSLAKRRRYAAGATIFAAGQPTQSIMVVLRGRVTLVQSGGGRIECTVGESLGSPGYVTRRRHVMTAEAQTEVEMLELPTEDLALPESSSAIFQSNILREAGLSVLSVHYPQLQDPTFRLLTRVLPKMRIVRAGAGFAEGPTPRHPLTVPTSRPIDLCGGAIVCLRGTIAEEGRTGTLPMLEVHFVTRDLVLGQGARLMHISAEAIGAIHDYLSFGQQQAHAGAPLPGRRATPPPLASAPFRLGVGNGGAARGAFPRTRQEAGGSVSSRWSEANSGDGSDASCSSGPE